MGESSHEVYVAPPRGTDDAPMLRYDNGTQPANGKGEVAHAQIVRAVGRAHVKGKQVVGRLEHGSVEANIGLEGGHVVLALDGTLRD